MDCSSFSSSCSSSSSSDLDQAGCSESATYVDLCPSYSNKTHSNRRGSYKGMTGSPRSRLFFCEPLSDDGPRHFLDSCFLCKKPLTGNRDIFMYRGDTPFCSEECRQEQIEMDEAKEKNRKLTLKPSTRKEEETQNQKSNATSSPKTQKIHVRTAGTVVAG